MRAGLGSVLALAGALALPAAAVAQIFRYLAYGDSITEGFNDSVSCEGCPDNTPMTPPGCGYPKDTRLPSASMLNCVANNCEIVNHGLSGEWTGLGITRLNGILGTDPDWDVMVLMHGSNDLFAVSPVPEETVRDNIKQMAHDAAELGIETLHASVIRFHYLAKWGQTRDDEIDSLGALVETLAGNENRYFADQRATLCGTLTGNSYKDCQNAQYCEDNPFPPPGPWIIGHPGPSGFDLMAQTFANVITSVPAPGAPALSLPVGNICSVAPTLTWTRESPARATWYEVVVEKTSGGFMTILDKWFPVATVSAINADPAISGVCSGTICSVTLSGPLAPGNYVWRVRGRNPRGRSAFTANMPFNGKPASTNGVYPAGDVLDTTPTTPTYRWLASTSATGYSLGGTIPATSTAGFACSGGVCSVEPGAPDLNQGSYMWTVTPSNSCGAAAASAPVAFSVVACTHAGDWPLENHTVTGVEAQDACGTIRAGDLGAGEYLVQGPSGDLTLHAGVAVELHDGFRVDTGGSLTVIADY